jgi:hypothetical protein
MPACRDCGGTGHRDIKKEITTRCPDCHGAKTLPNGADCERCNQWGEVGTGQFEVEKQLCKTCWGSGKVSEGSVMTWYLVRAVPATLLLVGGGAALAWLAWSLAGSPLLAAGVLVLFLGGWGGLMAYFVRQMPGLGQISTTTWLLMRAIPATVVALGAGGPAVWASWLALQNALVTFVLAMAVFVAWGILMFFFISNLPE